MLRSTVALWFVAGGRWHRVLSRVTIYYPGNLVMGANVGIASNAQLNAGGGIVIEDNVLVGPGAIIWSQNHKFSSTDLPIAEQGYEKAKVTLEKNSWVGSWCDRPAWRLHLSRYDCRSRCSSDEIDGAFFDCCRHSCKAGRQQVAPVR